MNIEDLRTEVLNILKDKDVTGRELIKNIIIHNKDSIRTLGFEKYNVENPASMGNFIANEIMPHLGVPVFKERLNSKGKKRTLYSLNPGNSRFEVKRVH